MSISETEKMRLAKPQSGPFVKYLVRRETHSSRALPAIFLALLIIAGLIYLVIEAILWMSKQPALLATPTQMWEGIKQITDVHTQQIVIPVGIGLILLGLFFFAKALLPGRLSKHSIKDERAAFIVDDGVIASNMSRKIREAGSLPAGQVTTAVSKRAVDVTVVPTTGRSLDKTELLQNAKTMVNEVPLFPRPKADLKITQEGQVAK